jgi:hypothetical protein
LLCCYCLFLIACVVFAGGDAPLGYIRWRVHSNPVSCKPVYGVVDMLAVSARARRQGIAKRLIGYCIQVCMCCGSLAGLLVCFDGSACPQDIAVRLMDQTEFVGMFAIIPREPVYIPQTFVRMGFRFVPPETPLPGGLVCPPPERREVRALLWCYGVSLYSHSFKNDRHAEGSGLRNSIARSPFNPRLRRGSPAALTATVYHDTDDCRTPVW